MKKTATAKATDVATATDVQAKYPRGSKLTCVRCDHEWITKKANPRVCPRCKSYEWMHPRKSA